MQDVIENPDRANEEVGNDEFIESRYHTNKLDQECTISKTKVSRLVHFNIHSLSKNPTLITINQIS